MLMKYLAASYLERLANRKRTPVKPATLAAIDSYVRNHIDPRLGELEAESVRNGIVKKFAEDLVAAGLGPKSLREIVAALKQILLSHQNEDGEPLLDLSKWNSNFILQDVPDLDKQRQPTLTREMIKDVLRVRHACTDKYRVLLALLLASGIRIGELTALRCIDDGEHSGWDQENSLLAIRTGRWRRIEQRPKTTSSIRIVDLSTPVNEMLGAYTKSTNKNPGDYLFATRRGTPFTSHGLHQQALIPLGIPGFHSMRRWRISHLKKTDTAERLIKLWAGHSEGNDVTARYDHSADDKEWRQATVNRVGIGFDLPEIYAGHPGPRAASPRRTAKPSTPHAPAESAEPTTLAEPASSHYAAQTEDLDPFFYQEEA